MRFAGLHQLGSIVVTHAGRFLSWWIGELRWFLPAKWRSRQKARVEVRQTDDGFDLTAVRLPTTIRKAKLRQGYLEPADFMAGADRRSVPVWLYPSDESILARHVQVPTSAAERFENLLGLEIDRWSPFRPEEVHVAWVRAKSDNPAREEIDLRLIPRDRVAALQAELAAVRLTPSVLVLGPEEGHRIDLRARRHVIGAKAIPAIITAVLAIALAVVDWRAAAHELEAWRTRYRGEVRALSVQRDLEEKINRSIRNMDLANSSVSKGKLLADLSAALPETDWLTEIAIKKENMTLRGYAANLERFIRALEPLAVDRNISLQGEVSHDGGTNRQRFAVSFRFGG